MKIYLVGGAVRDRLMNKVPSDMDYVVVGSTIEEMLSAGYKQVGNDFPVFIDPETEEEKALARKDINIGKGHKDFECLFAPNVTLKEDLARRDFTCNAIALNEIEYIDPFKGISDIENKALRAVSLETFADDPLRVLRLARFYAKLGFKIEKETKKLAKQLVAKGGLKNLTSERIWLETEKALKLDKPWKYFECLKSLGALSDTFPELEALIKLPQPKEYHSWDAYKHSIWSLKEACRLSKKPRVRFAALVHDVGKALTPEEILPHHYDHENNGIDVIKKMCKRLTIPNDYKNLAVIVCKEHMKFHKLQEMRPQSLLKMTKNLKIFHACNQELLEDFLVACRSDYKGKPEDKKFLLDQEVYLRGVIGRLRRVDNINVIHRARLNSIKSFRRGECIKQLGGRKK